MTYSNYIYVTDIWIENSLKKSIENKSSLGLKDLKLFYLYVQHVIIDIT